LAWRQATRRLVRVTRVAPTFRIVLLDEAVVAERGERVTVWFVRLGAGWVRATDHPEARVLEVRADRQDTHCPPGTIWRRTVELDLEQGTRLRRTVSRPQAKRMSPIEHLLSGSLEKRRQLWEAHFRVLASGRLERESA